VAYVSADVPVRGGAGPPRAEAARLPAVTVVVAPSGEEIMLFVRPADFETLRSAMSPPDSGARRPKTEY
jgi:hypothetical protein